MSAAETIDEEARRGELATSLRELVVSRSFKVPLLPEAGRQLLAAATGPDLSLRDLVAEIRSEPMIAAKVLSTANSSLYGNGQPVHSLHQAGMRLGLHALRDLLSQAVAEAYVFTGRSRRQLKAQRFHAVVVAYVSREIARSCGCTDPLVFLAGLFHDLGHPVLLQHLAEHPLPSMTREDLPVLTELVHPILGDRVARAWNLPQRVAEVARFHHCYRGSGEESGLSPVVSVVAAADRLAYHLGIGARQLSTGLYEDPIWDELGIGEEKLDELRDLAVSLRSGPN